MVRLSEVNPDKLEIGMKIRGVVRRLYDQEGIIRYGTKFIPAE